MESSDALRIIDEYLEEVRRYLPDDIADDIVSELRVNIMDRVEDMGGLTVENVYTVLSDLGPPRKLASKYVVGRGKRKIRFELGISEDLYPYFIQLSLLMFIVMVLAYTIKMMNYVFSTNEVSIAKITVIFLEMGISIILAILMLYILMSFVSSNPDLKEAIREIIADIFGARKTHEHDVEEKKKARRKMVARPRETLPREAKPHAVPYLISSVATFILSYVIYIYGMSLGFNWLMMFLVETLVVLLAFSGAISLIHFFYVLYYEEKSFALETLHSLTPLFLVPWLLLANIFTEDIQIIIVDTAKLENESSNIFEALKIAPIPSEYIILAKLLTIILLIAIIVGEILVILRYARTMPRKEQNPNI